MLKFFYNDKLSLTSIATYVWFMFVIISSIINMIITAKYLDNIVIASNNAVNLTFTSIVVAILAKDKLRYKVYQTSSLWLIGFAIKLVIMPMIEVFFSKFALTTISDVILGMLLLRLLLNVTHFTYVTLYSAIASIVIIYIMKYILTAFQQEEYSLMLKIMHINLFMSVIKGIAILVLTFHRYSEISIKIDSIRNFNNVIAHQILTALATMESHLSILKYYHTLEANEHFQLLINVCRKTRNRINFLMQNTKILNNVPAMYNTKCMLSEVVHECVDEYKKYNYNIFLTMHNDITFRGCSDILRCLVYNLVENAFQHGGPNIKVEVIICDNYLIVYDNGNGIDGVNTEEIFNMFTSSKEYNLGIGLTVCRDIMKAYGGSVECMSLEGHHTTFIVQFSR